MSDAAPRISVAIPLYNEQEVLPDLLARLFGAALDALPGGPHEIVFVDDGSSDRTVEMLEAAAADDARIVAVILSRNFGHQTALTAALDHVTGDVVVVMDGDLQDPPEAIPDLLAKHAEGYDVVYAQRASREEPWYLRLCYFLFYRLMAMLAQIRMPLDTGDFALLSRRVVDAMRSAPERQRYLRGLRTWVGFRQIGVPIQRPGRAAGTSKYTPVKLVRLALDGIFAFSTMPLRFSMLLGFLAIAGAMLFVVYAVIVRIFFPEASGQPGFTALIAAVIFSMGVQLVVMGVVGEYVGRIYEEVKGRPHYVVGRVLRREQMDPTYAAEYRRLYERHWWWRSREAYLLTWLRRLRPPGGAAPAGERAAILDVGCGDGLFFDVLERFGDVQGVESDASIVSDDGPARDRIYIGPLDDRYEPGRRFDLVVMLDVVEHVPDSVAFLRRGVELLAPGGRILITVPAFQFLWTSHDVINHHVVRYDKPHMRRLADDAGMTIETWRYFDQWTFFAKLLVRAKEAIVPTEGAVPRLPPAPINAVLDAVTRLEHHTLGRLPMPFGTSLLVVGTAADTESAKG